MKRILIPILLSAAVLIAVFSYQSGSESDKKLHVVFCDVGQGDATYIRTPGDVDILVDGGRGSKVLDCLSKYMPLWDRKIELVFATHPDADHIGGLVDVLKNYEVGIFGSVNVARDTKVFEDLQNEIKKDGIEYKDITAGDNFKLGDGVTIKTFWPEKGYKNSDTNSYSLVQVVTFGDFDLLLTGDIPYGILNTLPINGSGIDVFKLPHHGSKTGVDEETMAKFTAKLAIISVGAGNPYHHPHPSVMSLLVLYRMPYLRTDEKGSIEIVTDGHETKVVN